MPTATPRKILVTGANGFIGSALMAWYKNSDIPVVGVDLRGNGSNILEGDIAEPCAWAQLLDECDVVIHTAALVSNAMKDKEMWKANVLATRNLLNAAAEHALLSGSPKSRLPKACSVQRVG